MQAGILPKGAASACWHCPALPAAQSVFEACFGVMRRLLRHKWDGMGWDGMGWDGMSMHALPKAGVHVLCELGQPWVQKAELHPTSSVLVLIPYGSRGAIVHSPI